MNETNYSKPKILEYGNYRLFLKAFYEAKKAAQPGFSHRVFSRMAGFGSPNFIHLVIEGKRNLSEDSIEKCLQALKLGVEEARHFRNLVLLNQAGNAEERRHYAKQIIQSRAFRKLHPITQAQFEYHSEWHRVAIRELVALDSFREDPDWIAQALVPSITPAEARKAIDLLQTLKMIERDANGRLRQAQSVVSAGDEVAMASVTRFHQQMIKKGAESIELFAQAEREISSVTIGLSKKGALQIKTLIQAFRRELLAIAENDQGLDRIYQANFQFFPLSKEKS